MVEYNRKKVIVQNRYMRNRIYRMKQYNMLEQVPISAADFNALAVAIVKVLNSYKKGNYEGTEQLQEG